MAERNRRDRGSKRPTPHRNLGSPRNAAARTGEFPGRSRRGRGAASRALHRDTDGGPEGPLPRVNLARALSKLGILSRSQAIDAILAGRVRVDGAIVRDPGLRLVPERARLQVDEAPRSAAAWRAIVFHKPRGVVTARTDPEGRRTVYDVLGDNGRGLVAAGRLDLATTGLLILTTDTALAAWLTDPANAVPRVYAVTVRGRMSAEEARAIPGAAVSVRKASGRESHLVVELREGKNRQVRRLFDAIGHEVTRLKRVRFGGLELGDLEPGEWRELTAEEVRDAFSGAQIGADR